MRLPRYVEVETSRFCNRVCEWCPNQSVADRKAQDLLPWSDLELVVDSLAAVRYDGWFAFHNYNEPLANPRIVDELVLIRSRLPLARPTIFTNGDYLTEKLYSQLVTAGLAQMRITIYPEKRDSHVPSHQLAWAWLKRKSFLLGETWDEVIVRQGPALLSKRHPEIVLISPNIDRYYDRGGTVPWLSVPMRTEPCFLTSNSLSIDYRGNIKMCCNVVTGSAAHREYLLGNVRDGNILEIWNSPAFEAVRARHARADWTATSICQTCNQSFRRAGDRD